MLEKLKLSKVVIAGRSVGGRTSIQFCAERSSKTLAVILQHPVVPDRGTIASMSKPIMLSWAKDDGKYVRESGRGYAGHPYFGPHGASYIVNLTGCDLLSWKEADYPGVDDFYRTTFTKRVDLFLRMHGLKK